MNKVLKKLFDLHQGKFTGQVTLSKDQVKKTIYFKKGRPIQIDSTVRSETLGQMLVSEKKLTDDQYHTVLKAMQNSNKKQGEIIVELGFLSPYEVYQALEIQAGKKFQNSLLLEDPEITVEEGENHLQGVQEFSVDLFRIFVDFFSLTLSEDTSSTFTSENGIQLNDKGKKYLESQTLAPVETKLIRLLDGRLHLERVLFMTGGDQEEGKSFISTLSELGFIELIPKSKTQSGQSESKESEKTEDADTIPRKIITIEEEKPPPKKSSPIYMWALKLTQPYNKLLGLGTTFTKFQVRKGYDAAVRELHLDSIEEHYKDEKEQEAAKRVLDTLTLAFTILYDDKRRHDYLKGVALKLEDKEPKPAIVAEVAAQKARLFQAKRNFETAEQEIQKAIELQPEEASYLVFYAELLIQKAIADKKPLSDEIEKSLKKALALNSSEYRAFFQLGVFYKVKGDLEKARDSFSKVINLQPNHAQALSEVRLMNKRLEGKKKTESTFLKLLKGKPKK